MSIFRDHMHRSGFPNRNVSAGAATPDEMRFSDRHASVLHPLDEFVADQDRVYHSSTPPVTEMSREQTMASRRSERPFSGAPLTLRTMSTSMSMPEISYRDRMGNDSPTHQMGFMPTPPFQVLRHGSLEEPTSSPRTERLPSFRTLSKIADGCTDGSENRTTSYPALPAPPTMTSQSPVKSLPYFNTTSQQSSPSTSFTMLSHPSPTSVRHDVQDTFVVPPSPAPYPMPPDQSRYAENRRSAGSEKPPPFLSHGSNDTTTSYQSSAADSYSTANTTSTDSAMECTPNPAQSLALAPLQSPPTSGVFICEYSGCNAPPFQTQYLLNSHANVHSSNRPHYCPVKGCPRGDGGKGFKRKNEMIRHGLVHDSPGYICPFCPLREHKYPRPDNLQRHVRVHHVDKEKDDPLLREVLAQRPEGGNRGRRRRTGP